MAVSPNAHYITDRVIYVTEQGLECPAVITEFPTIDGVQMVEVLTDLGSRIISPFERVRKA